MADSTRDAVWLHSAAEDLAEIAVRESRTPRRIVGAVRTFARTGTGDIKKLEGNSEQWRLRSGDWRIIFERTRLGIVIASVVNRRDAYDD